MILMKSFSVKYFIRTKNIGNVKVVRRFRALSFSYEKVMISVAKRSRPSLRAKIGVNKPGINRHKDTKTVKYVFEIKTKNSVIF